MRSAKLAFPLFLLIPHVCVLCGGASAETGDGAKYPDPSRFENEIKAFEKMDKKSPPPEGAIVFFGSSTIRGWHGKIAEDLAPLTVVPRGFGGSDMHAALHYADRVVIPYRPRAIVLYEGDNDTACGIAPEKVRDTFLAFVKKIHDALPDTRIYFLSIKPSVARWAMWDQMTEANRLIAKECERDKRLTYIDMASATLGEDGTPRQDIFVPDNLHYNRKGYEIWRDTLRPILMEREGEGETGDGQADGGE